ncbi:MAG TPA: ornithine cyclodeaminase family protein [Terriglobales bacterium]
MRYFSEQDVSQLVRPEQVIAVIRNAFTRDFQQTVQMPVRTQVDLEGSVLILMPCYDSALKLAGVKTVTVNRQTGVSATYTLLDPSAGKTLAVMEANYLTELRTAATSALATDLLSRRDAKTLGIFGSGRQAFAHLAVLPCVRNFEKYLVCGSGRNDLSGFCGLVKTELGIELKAVDAESCVRESDVVCTCTTSPQPLFQGDWLRRGTHLNLVGAFQPHTREVDSKTVQRARVVVDTYDGCIAEAGDLVIPMKEQVITRNHILADLHEVASNERPVRQSAEDITLFKSVGCALEDLVVAKLVYEAAYA